MKLTIGIILLGLVVGTLGIPPWHPDWMKQFHDTMRQMLQNNQQNMQPNMQSMRAGNTSQAGNGGTATYVNIGGSNGGITSRTSNEIRASNGRTYRVESEDRFVGNYLHLTRKIQDLTGGTTTLCRYRIDLTNAPGNAEKWHCE